jgi:hypothetical protein
MSIMNVEGILAQQNMAQHAEFPQDRRGREPPQGLLVRAQAALEEVTKHEEQLQSLLSRVRGSNVVSHLSDHAKEPAPAGLPSIYDQLERRQKNMTKLIQDLSEMF